jgi:hypothetical protein
VALVLLPFFAINTLSVSIVTAASGDEYLTGSTEPIVEMVLPEYLTPIESVATDVIDTSTGESVLTGTTESIIDQTGVTSSGDTTTDTGILIQTESGST